MEIEAEKSAVEASIAKWKEDKERGLLEEANDDDEMNLYMLPPEMSAEDRMAEAMQEGKEARVTAHVPIPSQKDIEDALLRRKKQELMQMYALDEFDDETKKKDKKK